MQQLKTFWMVVLTGLATLASVTPAQAHHSFPANYLINQTVTIKGTVVQFLFRNPHSFVRVMAPDKDGKMVTWAVEWAASGALGADKVQYDTLKPGDKVIVTGNPGRDPKAYRLRMNSVERPADGWKWAGTFG